MEFKQYLTILKKYLYLILTFIIAGAALAFTVSTQLPWGYHQTQLFFINAEQIRTDLYNFDGYYAQERARNFTDTAVAMINHQGPSRSAKKVTPQLISITTIGQSPEHAQTEMGTAVSDFNQKLRQYSQDGPALKIEAVTPASSPVYVATSQKLALASGAVLGLIFAVFTIGLKTYFKL